MTAGRTAGEACSENTMSPDEALLRAQHADQIAEMRRNFDRALALKDAHIEREKQDSARAAMFANFVISGLLTQLGARPGDTHAIPVEIAEQHKVEFQYEPSTRQWLLYMQPEHRKDAA